MLRTRVIPVLLLHGKSLIKTLQFGKFQYIGDPANTVRIFNELEVDELAFLDIKAARERTDPDLDMLRDVSKECFMPLSYGGGITQINQAKKVFEIGFEKVIINTAAYKTPELVTEIAQIYGSQAVVVSIDVGQTLFRRPQLRSQGGRTMQLNSPLEWAREMQERGAGEILLTSMQREGTYKGFDLNLIAKISAAVDIPVIAHGGAGSVNDIRHAVDHGASAVALGSMVVFQKKGMGVLISFPTKNQITSLLE